MGRRNTYEWSKQMNENVGEIAGTTPNFASYLAGGDEHCILPRDEFHTVESGGVKLVDWLGEMVAGKPPADVVCEGDACGAPE